MIFFIHPYATFPELPSDISTRLFDFTDPLIGVGKERGG